MSFDDFRALLALTFRDPGSAARALMQAGWPISARWMAALVAVSVSAMLAWVSSRIYPLPEAEVSALSLTAQPLALAGLQLGAIVLAAGLMAGVGQIFGGRGRFEDALLLTTWIEVVLLLVQLGQLLVSLVAPGLAGMIGLAAIVVFLWLTVQFVKALHGFRSGVRVFLGVMATAFLAGFAMSLVAAAFGLFPEIAP